MVSPAFLRRFINLWPPLLFAGIRARHVAPDFRRIEVLLHLRFWNRNSMGTQFGGSLFAMTDPFYMLMLQQNLGQDYIIWDKAADIDFIAPGRGTVLAKFALTQSDIDAIKSATAAGAKYLPVFQVEIHDKSATLIARVNRTLYIRRKPATLAGPPPTP